MIRPTALTSLADEAVARCVRLARLSEEAGGTCRSFLSAPMKDCHRELSEWLTAAGATVGVDAAGNLRALYAGTSSSAPGLLIGSHLDTVPNAGAYDGVLGVVLGVALLQSLDGRRLPFSIEIIGFSDEEGVRFGTPFIGSRALVGRLDDALLSCRDATGTTVREALVAFGLRPAELPRAALSGKVLGYLEFHIEQGPVLESLGRPLGVVEGIAAQIRMQFEFSGRTNHAGTTPMHLRHDAVAGAAEWILAVESMARSQPGSVATVGQVEAKPGAINAISGFARVSLDLRHSSQEICASVAGELARQAEEIAGRRGLRVKRCELLRQNAVKMDAFLIHEIEAAVRKVGCEPHRMVSGAGHDAMILAEKVPSAMIFLRSPGGVSHDPAESVNVDDVTKALECGLHLLQQLAESSEFQGRTCRA